MIVHEDSYVLQDDKVADMHAANAERIQQESYGDAGTYQQQQTSTMTSTVRASFVHAPRADALILRTGRWRHHSKRVDCCANVCTSVPPWRMPL